MSAHRDQPIGPGRGAEVHATFGMPSMGAVIHEERTTERRIAASRAELLRRVMVEFEEMPGLRITHAQAQRLFGLREDVCGRVLATLVDRAILRRDPNGAYVVNGHRP